jgi:hypothetical protein
MPNVYNFTIIQGFGTGNISVNGNLISTGGLQGSLFVEAGSTVNVVVEPDNGYNTFSALVVGGPYTESPFSFTMPEQDLFMAVDFFGIFEPVDGYQLKYFWDYKCRYGEDRRLEIYEDAYDGEPIEKRIQSLNYIWGNMGSDPITETFVRSKITFDIAGEPTDFQEFLTGNARKFKAVYLENGVIKFTGFVNTDTLVMPERSGTIIMRFEALDGMRSFDSIRLIPQRAPFVLGIIRYIVGSLNQTYTELRPINISCEIFETRMDRDQCLFEQFETPFNAFYNDGRDATFSDGTRIVNQFQFIGEFLKRAVNPFMCRVFLFNNEWYIIRVSEHQKSSQKFYKYNPDGALNDSFEVENPYVLACSFVTGFEGDEGLLEEELEFVLGGEGEGQPIISRFGNAERTARLIFNEFTAILKLGVLDPASAGGLFESKFNVDDFFQASVVSTNPPPGTWILRRWSISNAQYVNDAIYGNTAGIQYVSSPTEFLQISGTSSSAGFSDPNLSYIELTTQNSGVGIPISQEAANKLSINLEFQVIRRDSTDSVNIVNRTFAMRVKVGSNYLARDGATNFVWTSTPTDMVFTIPTVDVWNTLSINNVVVPDDGFVEVRIYQLINTSTPHRYLLRLRNFKLNIEENEALALSEIASKSQTLLDYNNTAPDYITHIGDAITNNSTSAIRLIPSNDASKLWSRDGVEEFELLDILVQELANFKGRKNLRILGKQYRGFPDVTKCIEYDGSKWICNYFNHDSGRNETTLELFQIDT